MTTTGDDTAGAPVNRLAREGSAYLRQHMRNPVDWYPWGEEALTRAREEDKPLLISIGYSACHWCHVMERESFENEATAALMNASFVNVKVDREERPDVDRVYMDFVVRSRGQGGWPLTVFCTPAGRPFFGGTYFPPEPRHGMPAFGQVLQSLAEAFRAQRAAIETNAAEIATQLGARPRGVASDLPNAATLGEAARRLLRAADAEHGGFGAAPKFPTPTWLDALLAAADVLPPEDARVALEHVVFTCREMARRGLFDHVGGGFHRYCVDAAWTIPHFEKMLYDQGQLLGTYAEAWRRRGDPELVWPLRETAAYLAREMTGAEGAFFASQDADSEGEEGRFYVWTPSQLEEVLGVEDAIAVAHAYEVSDAGNFEGGTSHLNDRRRAPREEFADERARLLAARAKRVPPATDTKRVTSWNAWAVAGLARAGALLQEPAWLSMAERCAGFLLETMRDASGRTLRVFHGERATGTGFLEDVAGLLDACLTLYSAGGDERYLRAAFALGEDLVARFWDAAEGDFFLTPADGERLVHRPRAEGDGATPHAAALAGRGLYRLAMLAGDDAWRAICDALLRSNAFALERAPEALPSLARLAALAERGCCIAVVTEGEGHDALCAGVLARLGPDDVLLRARPAARTAGVAESWFAGRGPVGGRAAAHVCRGTRCSLPVTDAAALDTVAEFRADAVPASSGDAAGSASVRPL